MTAPVGSSASYKAATGGSLIREQVQQKIWEKNLKETPFIESVGDGPAAVNRYLEWTEKTLAAPNVNNKYVEGADAVGDDTRIGTRLGNHIQNTRKIIRINDDLLPQDIIG